MTQHTSLKMQTKQQVTLHDRQQLPQPPSNMKIDEIITNPSRDEYLERYNGVFDSAPIVVTIRDLELRKIVTSDSIRYGLLNEKGQLVGYLELQKYNETLWQVVLVQIAQAYKSQGYGTFVYDYAVMNDKLSILSDVNQSEGGPGGSKGLWEKLYRHGRFTVCGYDLSTDTVLPDATPSDVYNQKDNICWLATPGDKSINEMLIQENAKYEGKRSIVWYGPTIVPDGEF